MNILLVSHTFLPKYMGGTEVCTFEAAKELQKQGHTVNIFCADPLSEEKPYTVTESDYQGVHVYTLNKNVMDLKHYHHTYNDEKVEPVFEKLIHTLKPDVIHYHHIMHLSLECFQIGKKKNIPQILTLHDFWFQTPLFDRVFKNGTLYENYSFDTEVQNLITLLNAGSVAYTPADPKYFMSSKDKTKFVFNVLRKVGSRMKAALIESMRQEKYRGLVQQRDAAMRKALATVDVVILPTLFLFQELMNWGFTAKKVLFKDDPINTRFFKNFQKTKGEQTRFAFVGSIIPSKGVDVLVTAWKLLNPKNAVLHIYGNLESDPKYGTKIRKLAEGVKNLEFKGTFPADQIAEVYKTFDILVIPSRWFENVPLVLRNAFIAKMPVIATDLGSLSETISNGKSGYLFQNEDISELAEKMKIFIDNPETSENMKPYFPELVSVEDQTQEMIELYNHLLKQ